MSDGRRYRYILIIGSKAATTGDIQGAIDSCRLSTQHHVLVSVAANGASSKVNYLALKNGFYYINIPESSVLLDDNSVSFVGIDIADAVIAVWDGSSKNTGWLISKAKEYGRKLEVYAVLGS